MTPMERALRTVKNNGRRRRLRKAMLKMTRPPAPRSEPHPSGLNRKARRTKA